MTRTWNDKLHTATQVLLNVVTELHTHGKDGVLLRLVNSITDIAQLAEQLYADQRSLTDDLRRERERSSRIWERLELLERRYQDFDGSSRVQSQESQQLADEARLRDSREMNVLEHVVRRGESSPVEGVREQKEFSKRRNLSKTLPCTPPPPSPQASQPRKESISPYKPPPPVQLPPLPTLREVEAEQRQQRSRKRALASQKPPPCEKCRLRKRAMMLREHGHVKEDVFERWSKRPGECLQFMHYDEPVPEGNDEHKVSFPDTETQPPD